jgi:hypothetical protein
MAWKFKWGLLFIAGIPAFIGLPRYHGIEPIVQGLPPERLLYGIALHLLIFFCWGGPFLAGICSAVSLVVLPLIFVGASTSYVLTVTGLAYPGGSADFGPHYLALAVNMLSVIPLALSLVLSLPFSRFEAGLLQKARGVHRFEKYLLIIMRVFNHIAFSVIPSALEVAREEGWAARGSRPHRGEDATHNRSVSRNPAGVIGDMVYLTATCICSALRFIPLWAAEIAALPEPGKPPSEQG